MPKRKPRWDIENTPLPPPDPTVQTSEVVIGEKVYRLCLTTRALAQAERELVAAGHDVMLLRAFPLRLTLDSILLLFAASIRKFHPEVGFEEAIDLVTPPYIHAVALALVEAWNKSIPAPEKKANPTEPGSKPKS